MCEAYASISSGSCDARASSAGSGGTAPERGARAVTTVTAPPRAAPGPGGPGRWDGARVAEVARTDRDDALRLCESCPEGLTQAEAERRLTLYGTNEIAAHGPEGWFVRLLHTLRNPLVILLAILAAVSLATGDLRAATVMTLMIVLGVGLRFVQESRADQTAEALRAMIRVTATALRDGRPREIPLREILPGAAVVLASGVTIPADGRLLTGKDLFDCPPPLPPPPPRAEQR